MRSRSQIFLVLLWLGACYAVQNPTPTPNSYGLGCSFPLADGRFSCDDTMLGGVDQRRALFREYLEGCGLYYGSSKCEFEEMKRVRKNSFKPQSMINFTAHGFQKRAVPDDVMGLLRPFWDRHKHDNITEFHYSKKLPYSNNFWAAPTHLANVYQDGYDLVERTMASMLAVMEEWTNGEWELRATSMYGIRTYHRGTVINPHVDKDPLILSAIINIDQDVDQDWPLEVIARDGTAVNVTLQPGEMVLYEGHSTIHGRPFPLEGNFYANAFVHFEPFKRRKVVDGVQEEEAENAATTTTAVMDDGQMVELPPYLIPNTSWQPFWLEENPQGWTYNFNPLTASQTPTADSAIIAATFGNAALLQELAQTTEGAALLYSPDPRTGYHPLHQAARFGQIQCVKFLLQQPGVDINAFTYDGNTALSLAILEQVDEHTPLRHELFALLFRHGALTPNQLQAMHTSGSSVASLRQAFNNRKQAVQLETKKKRRGRTRRQY